MRVRTLSVLLGVITSGVLAGSVAAGGNAAAAGGPGTLDPTFGSGGVAVSTPRSAPAAP